LGLNHKRAIALLQLTSGDRKCIAKVITSIFADQLPENDLVTSLIYLLEYDISNVKPISKSLKIDPMIVAGVMGCIVGDKEAMKPFSGELSKKFNIKDSKILLDLLILASGDLNAVDKLNRKMNYPLDSTQIDIVCAIIWLTKKFRNYKSKTKSETTLINLNHSEADTIALSKYASYIAKRVCISYGIVEDIAGET